MYTRVSNSFLSLEPIPSSLFLQSRLHLIFSISQSTVVLRHQFVSLVLSCYSFCSFFYKLSFFPTTYIEERKKRKKLLTNMTILIINIFQFQMTVHSLARSKCKQNLLRVIHLLFCRFSFKMSSILYISIFTYTYILHAMKNLYNVQEEDVFCILQANTLRETFFFNQDHQHH